jgi:signal transduction histidine kinase
MISKQYWFLFLIIIGLSQFSFSQNNKAISKAQKYLVENKADSLNLILKTIPNKKDKNYLINISNNTASFSDYFELMVEFTATDKSSVLKLTSFIDSRLKEPTATDKLNLEYVKVRWLQISNLLNEQDLKEAAKISNRLNEYIAQFRFTKGIEYKKAIIYARIYPIIMYLIEKKIKEGKKLCLLSEKEAHALNDDFLVIFSKNCLNEFLVIERDLDGFIKNCNEIFRLEEKQENKTFFYESNVQQYLDAVIYKGDFDENEVENLLNELFSNDKTKYASYLLYAKYIQYQKQNSAACKRIYDKFQVKNLIELCGFMVNDAKDNLNSNVLNSLYNECSDALFAHKFFEEAYHYKAKKADLTQKIYSEDLSQSLADFQTQEKDLENSRLKQVNLEKEATVTLQRIIIWGTGAALLVLLVLAYFLYKSIRQRNKINAQLDNANKDLERLNLLNQKIFSVISHDFKGPVLTLSMLLDAFKKNTKDSYIAANINEVSVQFDNANSILDNLLNWAKAELNLKIIENPKANVKQIASEIIVQLEVIAKSKNITFSCEISESAEVALPDDILRIVFRNLISNAIKFSYENSVVTVSFDSQSMLLKIADSGLGMDEETAANLFKNEVVSSFGTHNEPGFGMGLYIISELLYKYKATVTVKSELNKGTIFTIAF